jgi:hypothetical protein
VTDEPNPPPSGYDRPAAKSTLACFDAAAFDRSQRHLHLAATAYLHAWWNQAA